MVKKVTGKFKPYKEKICYKFCDDLFQVNEFVLL